MRSVTLAVEADRHLHFVQLLTSRSLNLSKASKFSRSPLCTLSQSSFNHHSIGEPRGWWQFYRCSWRKSQDWGSACCTHTVLSKEFSHALKAITRGLAPRWVSQWVFLICQLVANGMLRGLFSVPRTFQNLHVAHVVPLHFVPLGFRNLFIVYLLIYLLRNYGGSDNSLPVFPPTLPSWQIHESAVWFGFIKLRRYLNILEI